MMRLLDLEDLFTSPVVCTRMENVTHVLGEACGGVWCWACSCTAQVWGMQSARGYGRLVGRTTQSSPIVVRDARIRLIIR